MTAYTKKTWETLNLPAVSGDTFFIVYNRESEAPGDEFEGRIYTGLIKDGFGIQNLNEVLSQYVTPGQIRFDNVVQTDGTSTIKFYIYYTQDDWVTWWNDTVVMEYDWSYEKHSLEILSCPIVNLLDYRQFFLYTLKAGNPLVQTTIGVNIEDRQIDSFNITGNAHYTYVHNLLQISYPGEFSYAYSYDFLVDGTQPMPGTYNTITIGASTYYVTNTCYRYAIYYVNKYGGWDSMLFRGKELQTDDLSRLSYKKNYVAQTLDYHKVDYLTTIAEKWELNTSYLNDIQSSRMINLLASNRIYLHDLETGHIAPVNVTNSSCEHKTYKNQGRKMSAYNVEVSASQPKYRM